MRGGDGFMGSRLGWRLNCDDTLLLLDNDTAKGHLVEGLQL